MSRFANIEIDIALILSTYTYHKLPRLQFLCTIYTSELVQQCNKHDLVLSNADALIHTFDVITIRFCVAGIE